MAFIFGGNTGNTYEGIQRQRKIAESLLAQSSGTPRNVGEGLTAIGNALAYRAIEKRAAKTEEKLRGEFDTAFSSVFGGGGQAQQPTYSAPAPLSEGEAVANDAMAALGKGPASEDFVVSGLVARGMPEHVARGFAMNFADESAFDPMAVGDNGNAFGLAQWNGPRKAALEAFASQSGKSASDPNVQLDFLMHELQGPEAGAWSKIAGAPDANSAAAAVLNYFERPAEVHRARREAAYLGGQAQPTQAPQMDLATLAELASSPMASPGQKAVLEALIGQQMDAADPMRQIELQRAQLELAQMQEPQTVKPLEERKALAAEAGLQPGTPAYQAYIATGNLPTPNGSKEYGLTPQYGTDKDGNLVAIQFAKDGTSIATPLPEGVALSKGIEKLDLGDSYQYVNTMTGEYVGNPIAKNTAAEAANVVAGKAKGEAQAALDSLTAKMPGLETVVAELNDLADKATYTLGGQAWDATVKQLGGAPSASAIARAEYIAKVDNQVLPLLRDTFGAAFTAKEGDTLRATLGDPDKSPQEKKAVLNAFIEQKKRDLEALAKQTGDQPAPAANTGGADAGAMSDDDLLKMYGQ